MEIKSKGVIIQVQVEKQPDKWLLDSAQEIAAAAAARGLELPVFGGALALEGYKSEVQQLVVSKEAPSLSPQEVITQNFRASLLGYRAVLNSINSSRNRPERVALASKEELLSEFNEWYSLPRQTYVEEALAANPTLRFSLVIAPNRLVSSQELEKAAQDFGDGQPNPTTVFHSLLEQYQDAQLSGTHPDNNQAVSFSLIPNQLTNEMDGTVAEQCAKLEHLQSEHPFLKVPSLLDAVTYWQTLRAEGHRLTDDTAYARTYISHFDLPTVQLDGIRYVPQSFVSVDGGAGIYPSGIQYGQIARLAVG